MDNESTALVLVAAYSGDDGHVFLNGDLFIVGDHGEIHKHVEEFRERILTKANVNNVEIKNMLAINVSGILEKQGYEIRLRD